MPVKRLKILIVDDNEMASELLSEFVDMLGYEAKTTANGHLALDAVRAERPDVVITDIVLPGLDGYELASQLRTMFGNDIRVIALSGLPRDNDRAEAKSFDAWLEKPLDLAVLERMLNQDAEKTE